MSGGDESRAETQRRGGWLAPLAWGIALGIACSALYLAIDSFGGHPPPTLLGRSEWPAPLADRLWPMEGKWIAGKGVVAIRVFHEDVLLGSFSGPEALNALQRALDLKPVESTDWFAERMRKMLKEGRVDLAAAETRYFASEGWLTGFEGDLYVVACDEDLSSIWVWYYFNF